MSGRKAMAETEAQKAARAFERDTRQFWLRHARSLVLRAAEIANEQGEVDVFHALTAVVGRLDGATS